MPFATSADGVRIRFEVEGAAGAPPLVLQHGFADSLEGWVDSGYVAALAADFRLVLIDARGHGASEKPHEPVAYDVRASVGDLVAVLDAVGVERARYLGFSMGGRIGIGAAQHAPGRLSSLVAGGANPWRPHARGVRAALRMVERGPAGLLALWEDAGGAISAVRRARLLANDVEALRARCLHGLGSAGLEDALAAASPISCLLYVGERDTIRAGIERHVTQLPHVRFVEIPGVDHIGSFIRSDLVLPVVMRFFEDAGKKSASDFR